MTWNCCSHLRPSMADQVNDMAKPIRTPPRAEQAVLGGLMLDNSAIGYVLD